MALHRNVHQGSYGEAFVHALACASGLTIGRQHLDVDGIDWQIAEAGARGTWRSPRIEVQVKTWSQAGSTSGHWTHRISVKHFNALAGGGFMVPRFLLAVIVPADADRFVRVEPDAMILQHAAYWVSLDDQETLPTGDIDPKTTVVRVPTKNLLTAKTLTALVRGDRKGART